MGDRVRSGIYAITNSETGDCYIGSSSNIENRMTQHRRLLRLGRHHSRPLQEAWTRYGEEAFLFEVLELVPDHNQLVAVEQRYLDERRPAYNPAHIALRNAAGVTSDPADFERGREVAQDARLALVAMYEELAQLRATASRDDDIMKVLAVAGALSPDERVCIEESADLASALYHAGMVSGRAYLRFLSSLAQHDEYDGQSIADEWLRRGLNTQEADTLMLRLRTHVNGADDLPSVLTELTRYSLNALASTVARELHASNDSQGFSQIGSDVDTSGRIVGDTRRQIEAATGRDVVSPQNLLRNSDGGLWASSVQMRTLNRLSGAITLSGRC